MLVDVVNIQKKKVGEVDLVDGVFAVEVKSHLLHAAVRYQLAKRRAGTHKVRNRTAVRGGGRKPFKQKGTGRARAGTIRAAQWRGGGVVFGPTPRSYAFSLNKKERAYAICSALTTRALAGAVTVIDSIELAAPKTKEMVALLGRFELANVLVVDDKSNANLALACRNLPNVTVVPAEGVNVYDILRREHLVLTKTSAEALGQRLGG